jgi:hypothetical protein
MQTHLDLAEVDGLKETRLGSEHTGVEAPASGGNNLTTSAVNSVSVQRDIEHVEANTSHVLLAQHSLQRHTTQ